MAMATWCEFAEQIEAVLKARGQGDTIPEGGLGHWVSQAWPPSEDDLDPEEWADTWLEDVAEAAERREAEAELGAGFFPSRIDRSTYTRDERFNDPYLD
jgi:hypothetical protein